jgi:SAM-dependent methyltransferase
VADGNPTCLVCGDAADELWTSAVDVEYETTADRFDYWLCRGCDALSIDPVPRDRLAEIYPSTYYSFAGGGDALAERAGLVTRVKAALDRRTFRRVVALSGTEAPSVLDVGGGTGEIAAALVAACAPGASGTVVDFDPDSIELARGRGLEGVCARFEDFRTERRFDVILMLNLIEHVDDPVGVLSHAAGLLAPGGVVWLQTPNYRSLDARLFRRRNWAGLHCPRHWAIFGRDGLERALTRSGLAPAVLRGTQAGAFWAASVLGVLRRRRPGRLGRPLVRDPFFLPLAGLGAGFDLATSPLRTTGQTICIARLS